MVVRIRLMRVGKKHQPSYRIVAVPKQKKRTGGNLENLGHYSPVLPGKPLVIDHERVQYWISKGAEVSPSARKLIERTQPQPEQAESGGAAKP